MEHVAHIYVLSVAVREHPSGCDALSSAPVPPSFSPSSFSGRRRRNRETREVCKSLLWAWKIPTLTKTDTAYWEKSVPLCFGFHTHSVVRVWVSNRARGCLFGGFGLLAFTLLQCLALLLLLLKLPLQSQNGLILSHRLLKTQLGFPLLFPANVSKTIMHVCVCDICVFTCVSVFSYHHDQVRAELFPDLMAPACASALLWRSMVSSFSSSSRFLFHLSSRMRSRFSCCSACCASFRRASRSLSSTRGISPSSPWPAVWRGTTD